MNIISEAQQKVGGLEMIDLKSCHFFSENRENYFDLTHFNYQGACRFTEYLSMLLREQYKLVIEEEVK